METDIPAAENAQEAAYWTLENLATEISNGSYRNTYHDLDMNEASMSFEEGTITRKVLFLGEGTPDELLISFEDGVAYKIYVSNRGRWRLENGIQIGTSLEKLNEINGTNVKFAGFEWDNSGYVLFENGAIDKDRYSISLSPNYDDIPQDAVTEFLGSTIYDSASPNVENLQLYVDRMIYKF